MIRSLIAKIYKNLRFKNGMHLVKFLNRRDHNALSENSKYQKEKLSSLLKHSFLSVPYYGKLGLDVDFDNLSYSEFCKIPILSKELIRGNGDLLISSVYDKKDGVTKDTSGGSTGEPVVFLKTKEQTLHGQAAYYHSLLLNNVDMFAKSIDLWGAERDMHSANSRFNLVDFLHNKTTLNTFVLSDEIINSYINKINKIKPKYIKAYVHSIYDMAKYINKNNIRIECMPVIQCTTGPLYPEAKAEISKAFNNSHVYNFYGSREVSSIASEVNGEEGLFVFYDNLFVEVLDKNNQPVEQGQEGEVVITTLNNAYMPLIRYKIGDRAVKGDDLEFGALKLDKVVGRTLGVIYKSDGTKIDGQFFTTLFFNKPGVRSFQLVQKSMFFLKLNLVRSESFDISELNIIIERIKKELPNVDLNVEFVQTINLTASGKLMYVYSELSEE